MCITIPESWVSRNGPEQRLPGLKYSQTQLLWVSAAQSWCSKHRDEALRMMVLTGVHSPDRFRVQVWEYHVLILIIMLAFSGHFL